MFGLAIEISLRLDLVTTVAFSASRKVIVLALRTNPTAIRKLKIAICLWLIVFFKLVLKPLSRPHMLTILDRGDLDLLFRPLTHLLGAFFSWFGHEECSVKHKILARLRALIRLKDRLDRWRETINAAASSPL